jgi:hypothetical protein
MKVPVVATEDYTIYYEPYDGLIWTHADVHKWTARVAHDFFMMHELLNDLVNEPFYCLVDNTKLQKFVKNVGYTYVQDAQCIDGVTRRIYRYG